LIILLKQNVKRNPDKMMLINRSNIFRLLLCLICIGVLGAGCNGSEQEPEETKVVAQSPQIADLTEKIKADPQNDGLYFARANSYLDVNEVTYAIADLNKAIAIDSLITLYYFSLSEIYFSINDLDNAVGILENCLHVNVDDVPTMLELARLHFYLEHHMISINLLNDVLRVDVFSPEAYFLKGMNFKELRDTTKAISTMQTAVEQNPDYYAAYMQLGLLLSSQKDPLALGYLDNAIRLDSNSLEAYYAKAMYYQENLNYKMAVDIYRHIINMAPQSELAFYNMGYIYYEKDSFSKAFRYFDMSIKVSPAYTKAYYMCGLSSEALGNINQASYYYDQTLNLDPDFVLAQEGMKRLNNE